jgi:hypothetical protein
MKNGNHEKYTKIFFKSFFLFFTIFKNNFSNNRTEFFNWNDYYLLLLSLIRSFYYNNENSIFKTDINYNIQLKLENDLDSSKNLTNNFFFNKILIKKLIPIQPIFSFCVYKIDKNIRKNSRRKLKSRLVWKYIASYKRLFFIIKWLIKEIKISDFKSFSNRIIEILNKIFNQIKYTFVWKIKQFSYHYVFKNFKNSLLTNYKTIYTQ